MSEIKVRVNTLKFAFGQGSQEPSDTEMFDFCRDWQMSPELIYSIHRDSQAKAIFIKFKDEKVMLEAKEKMQTVMNFNYKNGTSTNVIMSDANESYKYVRIFNLPPEIEDKDIHQVLSAFGVVRHLVRERYHQDTGFPVYSTVRGAHMEVSKELPGQIRVKHFQARVYYDGLVNKCFTCKSTEHVKANCPRKTARSTVEKGRSFSAALTGNANMETDQQAPTASGISMNLELPVHSSSSLVKEHPQLQRTELQNQPLESCPVQSEPPKKKSSLSEQKQKDHLSRADLLRNKDRVPEENDEIFVVPAAACLVTVAQRLRDRSRSARRKASLPLSGKQKDVNDPEPDPEEDLLKMFETGSVKV